MNTIHFNKKYIAITLVVAVTVLIVFIYHRKPGDSPRRSISLDKVARYINRDRKRFELRDGGFYINGERTRILSGAIHYFRVVPEYWRDRLIKLKSAGLNTVETYVPWNKHEEIRGKFNFEGILNIRRFISLAQELGLYVILRPGPYICSEWEFGGLPSWLLSDKHMKVRSSYEPFLNAVDKYFKELFKQVKDLQFHNSGPIIMIQIENEYGSFGSDVEYMLRLKNIMVAHGMKEQLFVSENNGGLKQMNIPGVFKTANFKQISGGTKAFRYLKSIQPNKPLMVMEFWSGWFDEWGGPHNRFDPEEFKNSLEFISESGASFNVYMFHGGTNFGFMNGQNGLMPDVTSYDYDAPLSEAGDITPKYHVIRKLITKQKLNKTELPDLPRNTDKAGYGVLKVDSILHWKDLLSLIQPIKSKQLVTMEMLNCNEGNGQGYGFILYQHSLPQSTHLTIAGQMNDRAQVIINGQEVHILDHIKSEASISLNNVAMDKQGDHNTLDILVENTGRITWGKGNTFDKQRKGIEGTITADDVILSSWKIYPLEFRPEFINSTLRSNSWRSYTKNSSPALYQVTLNIKSTPRDTFLNMQGWQKGVLFVNGFNVGRYWDIGPTRTLFVPAPLLKHGINTIVIFELHKSHDRIVSIDTPILE